MHKSIYVCGGSTEYLVYRIKELNIKPVIDKYIENGGIYIGVSAGSVCASGKYKDGLDFIENVLDVHCDKGTSVGIINSSDDIYLTDNQAIFIDDNEKIILIDLLRLLIPGLKNKYFGEKLLSKMEFLYPNFFNKYN